MASIHKSHKERLGRATALRLRACKKWLKNLAQPLGTTTLHYRRLVVFIPLK
jgi:hypothetical protein